MPTELVGTYDGGWFECDFSSKPTNYDPRGFDGLYVQEIRIRWWHPRAWLIVIRTVMGIQTKRERLAELLKKAKGRP